jgi:hypothetical protein
MTRLGGDLSDQLGPELVALAGDAQAQAQDLDAEHRRDHGAAEELAGAIRTVSLRAAVHERTPGGTSSASLVAALGSPATSRGRGARTAPGHQLAGDGGGGGNLGASTRSAALARLWSSRGAVLAVLALDRGARAGRRHGAARRAPSWSSNRPARGGGRLSATWSVGWCGGRRP